MVKWSAMLGYAYMCLHDKNIDLCKLQMEDIIGEFISN